MRRGVAIAAALVLVQALLVSAYFVVESRRSPSGTTADPKWTDPGEQVRFSAPDLAYRTRGDTGQLSRLRGKPVVVHFWASWCPPCREELPLMLRLAGEGQFELLAAALDSEWDSVGPLLGGSRSAAVVLVDPAAAQAFGVRELPETYLVDANGNVVARYRGPRDWSAPEVREDVNRRLNLK